MRAPVPAAFPAAVTRCGSQSGTSPRMSACTGSMWLPKAPASRTRLDAIEPVAVEQEAAAGVQRRLGELDLAHVVLRDRELGLAVDEDVREGAAVGDDARGALRERAVDRAVGRDHAGQVELCDRLDDPRAAHAGDPRAREGRVVRPRVAADHAEARLERVGVDAHALDRAGGGALPAADLRTLERRPGRAGRGEQPLAVPEHDLGVRADVDDQVHLVEQVRALGEDHAGGVGADVTGDARQHVHACAGVHGQPELARREAAPSSSTASANGAPPSSVGSRPSSRWCMIGLPTTVISSTSSRSTPADVASSAVSLARQPRTTRVSSFSRAGVHHHVRDAAHQVLAEADLRVHLAGRREHLAR